MKTTIKTTKKPAAKKKSGATKFTLKTGSPLPNPPAYLDKFGKDAWKQIVGVMETMGVADLADEKAVEACCAAYEEYRMARAVCMSEGYTFETFSGEGELRVVKRPEVDIMSNAWQRMRSLLPELCLTPMSRFKAAPPKEEKQEVDLFAEFIGSTPARN
jgi:P27 family predicted phage terminase small subunit